VAPPAGALDPSGPGRVRGDRPRGAGEERPGQRPRGGAEVRVQLSDAGCGCLVVALVVVLLALFIAGSVMASALGLGG
jgi:hypothetical protein